MSETNNRPVQTDPVSATIGTIALFLMIILFAVLAVGAVIGTVLAIAAWDGELRIGKHSITPADARAFFLRGAIGAAVAFVLVLFIALPLGFQVDPVWLIILTLGGYAYGSVGGVIIDGIEAAQQEAAQQQQPMPETITVAINPPHRPDVQPAKASPPFRFATWEDE